MAVAIDCLGLAEPGDGLIPAEDREAKAAAAARAGRRAVALAGSGPTARAFLDRRALLNAMAGVAASGGSTNGVLHLLAIAREAGVELTQDELTALASRTPVIASLSPGGRHVAETLHRAGGTPALIRELIAGGLLDGDGADRGGDDAGRGDRRRARARTATCSSPASAPYKPAGALRTLRGNLAPEGSLVKLAGTERTRQTGPGARLRRRGGLRRRRCARASSRPATCSSCATRARPAGRGCARC